MTLENMIEQAVCQARLSTCAKSRRGAVVFDREFVVQGWGHNGPPERSNDYVPDTFRCRNSDLCRASCSKVAVHAEVRALRTVEYCFGTSSLDLLHAKVDECGELVAGGPPSCVLCSKEILDYGIIEYVWLFEKKVVKSSCAFRRGEFTCDYCAGYDCVICDLDPTIGTEDCTHGVVDRHVTEGEWCVYTPTRFHELSLQNALREKNPYA